MIITLGSLANIRRALEKYHKHFPPSKMLRSSIVVEKLERGNIEPQLLRCQLRWWCHVFRM